MLPSAEAGISCFWEPKTQSTWKTEERVEAKSAVSFEPEPLCGG